MELLLMLAIGWAAANGIEKLFEKNDDAEAERVYGSKAADETVLKAAKNNRGPKADPAVVKVEKAAASGGKAARAVAAPRNARTWGQAFLTGFRTQYPEVIQDAERRREALAKLREQRRHQDEERKVEAEMAKEDTKTEAKPPDQAGPVPSADPPLDLPGTSQDPADRPRLQAEETQEADVPDAPEPPEALVPKPRDPDKERADAAEARAAQAHKDAENARRETLAIREQAASDWVLATQQAVREANTRAARVEEQARAAAANAVDPEALAERPRLTVVPDLTENGDLMSSPVSSIIPEIRTLDGLMNALHLTKAMCAMRSEEAEAIAGDDWRLANQLDQIESQMAAFDVDDKTRAEVNELRESIHLQSQAAAAYGSAAKNSGDFAVAAAQAAYKTHGGIAEAVQSAPIKTAAQSGYYDR